MAEADEKTDLLMRISAPGGNGDIAAEAQALIVSNDALASDSSGGSFTKGQYFLVDEFDFGLGNREKTAAVATSTGQTDATPGPTGKPGETSKTEAEKQREAQARSLNTRWVSEGRSMRAGLMVEVEPFGFKRLMDKASLALFTACSTSATLASASLIRRRPVGLGSLRAVMRLDFTDVLITELRWQEGRVVTEDCKFICRAIRFRYLPQNANGTLGAAVEGRWPGSRS